MNVRKTGLFGWLCASVVGCADNAIDPLQSPSVVMLAQSAEPDLERAPAHQRQFKSFVGEDCVDGKCSTFSESYESTISSEDAERLSPADAQGFDPARYQREHLEEGRASKEALRAEAALRFSEDAERTMNVQLWLYEDTQDRVDELRGLSDDERAAWIERRSKRFAEEFATYEKRALELGGRVSGRMWLTKSIVVRVPAVAVPQLVEDDAVFAAYGAFGASGGDAMTGLTRRKAFHPSARITANGDFGGNATGDNVRIGIVEQGNDGLNTAGDNDNQVNMSHVGWFDSDTSTYHRVRHERFCTATPTPPLPNCYDDLYFWPAGTLVTHGTTVASIAAGSIIEDQDISQSTPDEQEARSGIAGEAHINYFMASEIDDPNDSATDPTQDSALSLQYAIQDAVAYGDDVINMSWGIRRLNVGNAGMCASLCTPSYMSGLMHVVLANAIYAGASLIKSSGNEHDTCPANACSVSYPGWLPPVIAVGGTDDMDGLPNLAAELHDVQLDASSGRGFRTTTYANGSTAQTPTVGLVAFGSTVLSFAGGNTGYDIVRGGTSVAAPQVTSLASAVRQHLNTLSTTLGHNAWLNHANILLMGDGRKASEATSDTAVDAEWGYGFPKYFLDPGDLGTISISRNTEFHLNEGETIQWFLEPKTDANGLHKMRAGLNGFKWVILDEHPFDGGFSKLEIKVIDVCPSGGGTQTIATAATQAGRHRLILRSSANITGRCLKAWVRGLSVPSGGMTFANASFFFSAPLANHIYVP